MEEYQSKKSTNSNNNEVLLSLLEDPTRSIREIARDINVNRQRVSREKNRLEKENVIWGYTAVIDEIKLNRVEYIYLGKLKFLSKEYVDKLFSFWKNVLPIEKETFEFRIINMFYLNGEFDLLLHFSVPNERIARRWFENIRHSFVQEFHREKPLLIKVVYPVRKEDKNNPSTIGLEQFLPLNLDGKSDREVQDVSFSYKSEVLQSLLEDPTRTDRDIANGIGVYRQKVWREKNRLEKENVIWGYTAVVDEKKLDRKEYLILLKTKPIKEYLELLLERYEMNVRAKYGVRGLNFFMTGDEYDLYVHITAPDITSAKRYFESIKMAFQNIFTETPVLIEVLHPLWKEGKRNPDIQSLRKFLP